MSSSAVFILDVKGKVLISRNYRGDIDMSVIDKFMPLLMEKEEEGLVTPIIQTSDCTFAYIKTNNLYIVSTNQSLFLFLMTLPRSLFILVHLYGKDITAFITHKTPSMEWHIIIQQLWLKYTIGSYGGFYEI